MKTSKLFSTLGALALVLTLACTPDEPVVKPHRPSGGTTSDVADPLLPQAGPQELFTFANNATAAESAFTYVAPPKKSYYRPIVVEISTSDKPKASRSWKKIKTRVLANVVGFTPDETITTYKEKTNKYGSSLELPRQAATGRFYVTKIGPRWWFVDPEGYLHHHRGITSVRYGSSERNKAAFQQRFGGDDARWLYVTQTELANVGIHGTGAFCTDTYQKIQTHNAAHPDAPLMLCPSFGFIGAAAKDLDNTNLNSTNAKIGAVLHPNWESWVKEYAKTALAPYKGDPNVVGIFSDNEIPFGGSSSGTNDNPRVNYILYKLLNLPADHFGHKAAQAWVDANYPEMKADYSNMWWSVNLRFTQYLAEKYYKGVSEAIKAFDPQMLYLGTRLHGEYKTQEVVTAAGKYCDVVSINYYGNWTPQIEVGGRVSEWEQWSGKPFLVTEFYTKGIDDSDLNNESGAGFAVRNQAARAYAYQNFTLGLLQATNCVGWHWFKYQDDDGTDNSSKPANKGLYDNSYQMFPYLGRYMKNINIHAYDLINFFDTLE
ncbi:MAG: hypothetical protein IKA28_02530 [Tidjanibacter sp.]|nr:hypothetical protein [Tidjanibacter sp.]